MQVVMSMIVCEASPSKTSVFAKIVCSTTKQESKLFIGLAMQVEVERYCKAWLLMVFEYGTGLVPSVFYHASSLISITKDSSFYLLIREISEKMHQEWSSWMGCNSI